MSRRGGGSRQGGGRGGYGGFPRESEPPPPTYGRGRGQEGSQRGRGGFAPPPAVRFTPAPPTMASSGSAESSLSREAERLSLSETKPGVVSPGSSSVIVPAPVDVQPRSSKSIVMPPRPGFGGVGRRCVVRANHFLVQVTDKDLCHYDVAIVPETKLPNLNRSIIAELVKLYQHSDLGGRTPVYDGRKNLYTAGELPFTSKAFVIKLAEIDGKANGREKEYRVTIKFAAKADLHHLQQFLQGRQFDSPQETIHALDVVLRESPCTKYKTVARSFFSPQFSTHEDSYLGGGVEYWRGFYQSLRPTQMGLSLNTDTAATSFYMGGHLMDFVAEYLNIDDFSRPITDNDRNKLKNVLKGVRVETTHNPDLQIRYKINGISSLPIDKITFPDENGTRLSIVQYFRNKYDLNLKCTKWPCLMAGNNSKPKYLPMEVCQIIPGQRYVKKLNETQVAKILRATAKRPKEREASILQVVNGNNYNSDNFVKEFGLKICNQMVSVDARVLPPPTLKYNDSGEQKSCQPSVGQWNMMRMKMFNGGSVDNWTCLNFSQKSQRVVLKFCNDLVAMCKCKGMVFNTSPCIDLIAENPRNLEASLRNLHQRALINVPNGQLDLVIVILPESHGSYGMIKKVCETELGIVSQCCSAKNVSRCNPQYLENVSLKINVKVGGRNTVLEDALNKTRVIPYLTDRPTIIFGADVTHPAPGEDSSPSIAAVVASMDWPEVTKYRGVVSAQTRRQEMIEDLFSVVQDPKKGLVSGGMVRQLLVAFYKSTGRKPDRIIFYRDGVSEGQFSHVLLHEMDKIRKACVSLEEGYLPRIRRFVIQRNLISIYAVMRGTSRPTHYHVLYDENEFTADGLQTLTNNLCYTYARCTRSVSIVPPAYYAHLAAFRARYYMEAYQSDASTSTGDKSRENPGAIGMLPKIQENVKNVMFYC
ncbi:protein argonaute MEL1-like protein [Carex littledalei]|uniref:Protein argonaute MEL1-like protein n=1 Tax=Carex littledalei TaxID=544730 RepID=A0A833VY40_9POAL|nr:protein argonaute MEL1-like protein [Carex littledalei]